jgi:pyruvate dehydrogenase E2 component (dihydrolipoamide acetyltransferase)/2-oxoisovalerate dehydrogenase E2 component (dihydrolipoyl transacylase)
LARKLGVDLSRLQGSGPNGRILVDDVTTVYEQSRAAAVARPSQRTHTPLFDLGRPGTRVKLAGLRRLTAERMTLSAQTIPQATYVEETNVTDLVRLRESLKPTLEQRGSRLTYLPFMVKAVALALREVPIVNASLEDASREIVLHDHYHIGVAVATPNGLIVPVVKDADQLDLLGIASEIERLSTDARAGKSSRDDLQGATFTITSVGNFGGILSTPMVNPPEAAILGIGRIVRRPVFDDRGQVVPADLVHLSLTFDHRLLDGAVAAVFVNAIVSHLRAPAALLLPPA